MDEDAGEEDGGDGVWTVEAALAEVGKLPGETEREKQTGEVFEKRGMQTEKAIFKARNLYRLF